jgi:hypothetical protein
MSAMAMNGLKIASRWEVTETCKVAVMCEDAASRDRAVEVFNRISATFRGELAFAISCWNFGELAEAECARSAAAAAASADIIMYSTRVVELPVTVGERLDGFAQPKGESGFALAFLLTNPDNPSASIGNMISRLTQVAHRLGMDFVPLMPMPVDRRGQDIKATEWTVTAVRKEVGGRSSYDHWGLNE